MVACLSEAHNYWTKKVQRWGKNDNLWCVYGGQNLRSGGIWDCRLKSQIILSCNTRKTVGNFSPFSVNSSSCCLLSFQGCVSLVIRKLVQGSCKWTAFTPGPNKAETNSGSFKLDQTSLLWETTLNEHCPQLDNNRQRHIPGFSSYIGSPLQYSPLSWSNVVYFLCELWALTPCDQNTISGLTILLRPPASNSWF